MPTTVHAYAATAPHGQLQPFEFQLGELGPHQIDIAGSHCGLCHSDLSMWTNEWGMSAYPFVPGHEAVGKVAAVGSSVGRVKVGDTVGLGWYSKSCMECTQCMTGNHNLCPTGEQTIVGRYGAFADLVRCSEEWATPLAAGFDVSKAGPLFCGGVTVFNPIVQFNVRPTDRVGVVGIGGLGHMALKFLNKWGCHVTAFTSSESKREEALKMGAHQIAVSTDPSSFGPLAKSFDFILVTVNAGLNWPALIGCLRPKGRLHFVGAVPEPISVAAFQLIGGQYSLSGSPLGSPATTAQMIEFCERHQILPQVEFFPMSKVNEAFAHLEAGKARYRIVLTNDIA